MVAPIVSRSIVAARLLSGILALFAAAGQTHAQGVTGAMRAIPEEDMIELAKRSCHAQIIGNYSILPDQVSIQNAVRENFRINVYGAVRQPPRGRPLAFVCMVSAYQGTGRSFGQVFGLQYSRIEESG